MARWRQLKANAGWRGLLQTALMLVICVAVFVINPEPPYFRPVMLAALAIPYLLKGVMVNNPERSSTILKFFAYGIFGLAFFGQFIKDSVDGVDGIVTGLFSVIALYSGLFFWLWSDSDILKTES